jgi:hypothetical protein
VSQTAPAATSTSNADTPTPSPTANPAAWPQQEAPDLRSTRDRHPAPGQTNPANGE